MRTAAAAHKVAENERGRTSEEEMVSGIEGGSGLASRNDALGAAMRIYSANGIRGFYFGLAKKLNQTATTSGLLFALRLQLLSLFLWLGSVSDRDRKKVAATTI